VTTGLPDSPRWTRFGCGATLGAILAFLLAPRLQRWLRVFGVNPYELAPALVVIACAAVLGGVLFLRTKRWR
jgi:hypothetical protein